jgi:hypothetical protein
VDVLSNTVQAVRPGGLVFDLQVIRPDPVVETDGRIVCAIDGEPLFRTADAAVAALDALVRDGRLVEEAVDDHDVRKHYANGRELLADFAGSKRKLPPSFVPELQRLDEHCSLRERCRLRRLAVRHE